MVLDPFLFSLGLKTKEHNLSIMDGQCGSKLFIYFITPEQPLPWEKDALIVSTLQRRNRILTNAPNLLDWVKIAVDTPAKTISNL